jgi:hypothetical protein
MALITSVGFVLSILAAVLSRVVVAEIEGWSPLVIRALIKLAVARLPEKLRERYAEEWQSHVNEVPGVIGKVFETARFSLAARKMVRIERHTSEAESWRQKVTVLEELQSGMSTAANALNATHKFIDHVVGPVPNGKKLASDLSTMSVLASKLKERTEKLAELVSANPPTYLGKLVNQLQRRLVLEEVGMATPAEASAAIDEFHRLLKKAFEIQRKLRTHPKARRPA